MRPAHRGSHWRIVVVRDAQVHCRRVIAVTSVFILDPKVNAGDLDSISSCETSCDSYLFRRRLAKKKLFFPFARFRHAYRITSFLRHAVDPCGVSNRKKVVGLFFCCLFEDSDQGTGKAKPRYAG